ncbi:hypothetical protein LSH36_563g01078 [Paralvinella palmiformis]|uniref:Protein Red n=1 Tax=Paralvinella palmiformis TaxID=53620 RepID=A0AAD9MVD8_9ANNE|nr:hypothetical protein LSH36_563g01078 [Paralvinella palmiformis]
MAKVSPLSHFEMPSNTDSNYKAKRGGDAEAFSNPLAPPTGAEIDDGEENLQPLTNEDFRKLLMTPRVSKSSAAVSAPKTTTVKKDTETVKEEEDPALKRKKKKIYYAKLKKLEEERQKELAEKYRDRAKERRDGANKDYEQTDIISTTADYRAVAPNAQAGENYQERRKQIIQESKYLGGDMEHTHLVKGLDYALLDKVRAEIVSKEEEKEAEMEAVLTDATKDPEKDDPETYIQFRTKLGRNIYRTLFKRQLPERNDLFIPGRMAYVVDLEDEYTDFDVPVTLIRSKADCVSLEATTTLTTNDIVINKLTQILSYLRQGKKDRRLKKKDKGRLKDEEKLKGADDNIYDGVGDYAPTFTKDAKRDRKDRDRDRNHEGHDRNRDREHRNRNRDRDRDRITDKDYGEKKSYFEKPVEEDDIKREAPHQTATEMARSINDRFSKTWDNLETTDGKRNIAAAPGGNKEREQLKKIKTKTLINSYAECYPGMMESADAIDDSDDEVDYTKMDKGNKKGPIGRWDFDTQEEYSDYMSNKEALPKAAFQYGVKMADGRKTRRTGPKDEKKELDREWQRIQNIIAKRKHASAADGSGGKQMKFLE